MQRIFVSYKREDREAVAHLVDTLRKRGFGVWWDQDIPPEAPWEATIEEQLASADVVIAVWTRASVTSENVKAEARWAREREKLVQVSLDGAPPPLFFSERQAVDLSNWRGAPGEAYLKLEAALRGTEGDQIAAPRARTARRGGSRPAIVMGASLLVAAGLAAMMLPEVRALWGGGGATTTADLACDRYVNDAENAIDRERYSRAVETFGHVIDICDDPVGRAHLGLSNAYWHMQDYGKALEWGKKALAIVDASPDASNFDAAVAHKEVAYRYLATGEPGMAAAHHEKVLALLQPSDIEYLSSLYSIGEAELMLWLSDEAPGLGQHHDVALRHFRSFLELDGRPDHWAKYSLACLLAGEGGAGDAEARRLIFESAEAIRRLPQEKKGPIHRRAFRELLLDLDSYLWRPTYPAACPPLAGFLERCGCRTDLEAVIRQF